MIRAVTSRSARVKSRDMTVNEQSVPDPAQNADENARRDLRLSPIRPQHPGTPPPNVRPSIDETPTQPEVPPLDESPTDPQNALVTLRRKMEAIADEFADGRLNRAQFNAVYKRYSEQRAIIERLIERNPDSDAWRNVFASQGQTGFLRTQYAAAPVCYSVYLHHQTDALIAGGRRPMDEAMLSPILRSIWRMRNRPAIGVGRRMIAHGEWLILTVGEYASTAVVFSLEPSISQARLVRDLHTDFERANQAALERGWIARERMVFPQRSLVE